MNKYLWLTFLIISASDMETDFGCCEKSNGNCMYVHWEFNSGQKLRKLIFASIMVYFINLLYYAFRQCCENYNFLDEKCQGKLNVYYQKWIHYTFKIIKNDQKSVYCKSVKSQFSNSKFISLLSEFYLLI